MLFRSKKRFKLCFYHIFLSRALTLHSPYYKFSCSRVHFSSTNIATTAAASTAPLPLLSYFVFFIMRAFTLNEILPFTLLCYFVSTLVVALVATISASIAVTLPSKLPSRSCSKLVFYF